MVSIRVAGESTDGYFGVGGIAMYSKSTGDTERAQITDCKNRAKIYASNGEAGGIVSVCSKSTVLRCDNSGTIRTLSG